jgi:predicted amidohydrolase YtcJ
VGSRPITRTTSNVALTVIAQAGDATQAIDLGGKTLLPAFIGAHRPHINSPTVASDPASVADATVG